MLTNYGAPKVPLLCLDLDGTVREGKDDALGKFVNGPEDVRVFPAAVEMMRRWKNGGGRIIAVTNQGGIAMGYVSREDVFEALNETYRQCEGMFDLISVCTHHPDASLIEDARCWCRKPRPGMIIDAVVQLSEVHGESYPPYMALMVGDRPEDQQCAEAAGVDFVWAADWRAQAKI